MEPIPKHPLKYSRQPLVSVTNLLGDDLDYDNSADLLVLKAKFVGQYDDPKYIVDLRAEAQEILNLPVSKTRIDDRKWARINMKKYCTSTQEAASSLLQFIPKAFPPDEVAERIVSTTIPLYRPSAFQFNWEAVSYMQIGMQSFLTKHETVLLSKGGMPETFIANFKAMSVKYENERSIYGGSNNISQLETIAINEKINALGDRVTEILADLRSAFYTNSTKKHQYTYASLLRRAIPGRVSGGIRFGIFDALTDRPIFEAKVSTSHFSLETLSNKKGRVDLNPLPAGEHSVTIEAAGYPVTVLPDILVKKGIKTTLSEVRLSKMAASASSKQKAVAPEAPSAEKPEAPATEEKKTASPVASDATPAATKTPEATPALDTQSAIENANQPILSNGHHV